MQMYYFYGLTSVLASIGGSGQRRVAWRLRIGLRFDRKLKKRFVVIPSEARDLLSAGSKGKYIFLGACLS